MQSQTAPQSSETFLSDVAVSSPKGIPKKPDAVVSPWWRAVQTPPDPGPMPRVTRSRSRAQPHNVAASSVRPLRLELCLGPRSAVRKHAGPATRALTKPSKPVSNVVSTPAFAKAPAQVSAPPRKPSLKRGRAGAPCLAMEPAPKVDPFYLPNNNKPSASSTVGRKRPVVCKQHSGDELDIYTPEATRHAGVATALKAPVDIPPDAELLLECVSEAAELGGGFVKYKTWIAAGWTMTQLLDHLKIVTWPLNCTDSVFFKDRKLVPSRRTAKEMGMCVVGTDGKLCPCSLALKSHRFV